jgi:hypothetical protein
VGEKLGEGLVEGEVLVEPPGWKRRKSNDEAKSI